MRPSLFAAFIAGALAVAAAGQAADVICTGAPPVNGADIAPNSVSISSGDLTLSATTDLNLGNNPSSNIRAGSGILELGDHVGFQASYGANNILTMTSASNTLLSATGTTIITGDTTSPTLAAFRITPQDAEPTGANVVGNMYVTSAGVLKICTAAGTPGTWVSVGAQ